MVGLFSFTNSLRSDWLENQQNLPMPIERVRSNPKIRENGGKVALQRGPIVYCLEEIDNQANLSAIYLSDGAEFSIELDDKLKLSVIVGPALRWDDSEEELYTTEKPLMVPVTIKAIPYFAWDNRKLGEMQVWINEVNEVEPS